MPKAPNIPKVITLSNYGPLMDALSNEPCLQCGSKVQEPPGVWFRREVVLEFPQGELCEGGLKTLALVGFERPTPLPLTGREGFVAQGLEGKVQVRKDLFYALLGLEMLPERRGRVLTNV